MVTFLNILSISSQIIIYFFTYQFLSNSKLLFFKMRYPFFLIIIIFLLNNISVLFFPIITVTFFLFYSNKVEKVPFPLALFYSLFIVSSNILLGNAVEWFILNFLTLDSIMFFIIHFASYSIIPFGIILLSFRLLNIQPYILKNDDLFVKNKIILPENISMIIYTILIPLISYLETFISKNNNDSNTKYIVFILFFMYFILIAFLKVQLDKYQQLQIQKEKEEQLAHLNLYVTEIEELYQTVRGFRHDYGNILVSMRESIYHGSPDEIKQTYEDILKKSHLQLENHNYHYAELANVKDIPLKSILVSKLLTIEKLEIPFTLEVKHKVHFHQTDILEVVRILSILIDNAIDEVKSSSEQSNGKIRLALINGNEQIIVIIENTVAQRKILPQSEQLGTLGYSTKGAGRGTGLFNLTKIIEGHPEIAIETKIEPEWFSQILTFENKAVE